MSDLLNSASLVMIPSGYKEDVVYSQIPTDGSGDLSFTRASNGTRINSAGLVEVCPWNLAQYSEDLSNAVWTKGGTSITTNATTAPNGTTTADKLVELATTEQHQSYQSIAVQAGTYTFSVYLKQAGRIYASVYPQGSSMNAVVTVNLSTGVIVSATGATYVSSSIESVGDGWYKVNATLTTTANNLACVVYLSNVSGGQSPTYTGNGTDGIFIWGAQLNIGSTAKPYFPTTDRLNVPRLTYQNGGGGCPSLLLEKQSTNYIFPSEDFTNAAWTTSNGASVTANQTTSPDGTQNADKLTFAANSASNIYNFPVSVSGANTISVWAKTLSGTKQFRLRIDAPTGTTSSDFTATTTWQRFDFTVTTTTQFLVAYIFNDSAGTAGDLYIWGAQLEASSYLTSYIPTTSSSATRVADVMSVNLPNTDMTFCAYLECEEAPLGTTAGDWLRIYSSVSQLGRAYGYSNLFGFADAYSIGEVSSSKMVWKQESGTTAKIFKDGVLVLTSTTGTYSDAFNTFEINGNYLDKPLKIKEFLFFQNNLTDAECAALTA